MRHAITKYYFDLTRYNLGFSVITGLITWNLFAVFFTFATFGMLIGLICYKQFQNNQYYFYFNLGVKKSKLIIITWTTNVLIAMILLWMIQ